MSILAATDGTAVPDRVIETGGELARQFGDELVVVHVIPQDVFEEHRGSGGTSDFALEFVAESTFRDLSDRPSRGGSDGRYTLEHAHDDAEAVARDVTEKSLEGGTDDIDVRYQGRVGDVTTELLTASRQESPRYLVVGGRKRTPVGKALFGSVTQSVLLEADVPVVAVMDEQ